MISKINICNSASFQNLVEVHPRRINYIYGGNGSGKTTISRILRNPTSFPESTIEWETVKREIVVYNKEFVKENFDQDKLKGIFTLGKEIPEAKKSIEEKAGIIEKKRMDIEGYSKTIESQQQLLEQVEQRLIESCWIYKTKHAESFRVALSGTMGAKQNFKNRCVLEQKNQEDLKTIDYLLQRYETLYKTELIKINEPKTIDISPLEKIEKAQIFSEIIVGKNQSQIGELIKKLGNSDWVNQGVTYLNASDSKKCPFCQREMDHDLIKEIEDYFDLSYLERSKVLTDAINTYKLYVSNCILVLSEIITEGNPIYDYSALNSILPTIKAIYTKNENLLEKKLNQKSSITELESIKPHLESVIAEINAATEVVRTHNEIVKNADSEKVLLLKQIWKYLANETKIIINEAQKEANKITIIINSVTTKKELALNEIHKLEEEIKQIESTTTNTKHVVNEINRILSGFHFNGFKLTEVSGQNGYYQIIRQDGTIAKDTLSEGEYNFITFLYFFHLIKGSTVKSEVSNKKIVVIDDPISSLDSNVLFIVSNLVKTLIDDSLNNYRTSNIRQVFILTHNIYFHKEISFKGQRESTTKHELFWIVYKTNEISNIKISTKNPINTTYSLLWDEIKNPVDVNNITIFNSLRRILEYYFKIIGNIKYEDIINKFDFEDQQTCKSLISWINDGSHFINDDLLIETEIESVDRYLKIFKDIFNKLGHISHYNMMMV